MNREKKIETRKKVIFIDSITLVCSQMHVIKRSYLLVPRVLASDLLFVVVVAVDVQNLFLVKKKTDGCYVSIDNGINKNIDNSNRNETLWMLFYIIVSVRFQATKPLSLI